jgi:hypothetical protein
MPPSISNSTNCRGHYQNLWQRRFRKRRRARPPWRLSHNQWSWKRDEPRWMINPKLLELETAKQILAEIFHARTSDVEEMIQSRLVGSHRLSLNPTTSLPFNLSQLDFSGTPSSCKTTSSSVCLVCKRRARSLLAIEPPCSVSVQRTRSWSFLAMVFSTCSESYGYLYLTAIYSNSLISCPFGQRQFLRNPSCGLFGRYFHESKLTCNHHLLWYQLSFEFDKITYIRIFLQSTIYAKCRFDSKLGIKL